MSGSYAHTSIPSSASAQPQNSPEVKQEPNEHHNKDPKPLIWTASAADILAKVTRAKAALARVAR